MSEKQRGPPRRNKHTFLPERGQGSDDREADYIIGGIVTLIRGVHDLIVALVLAVWPLIRYVCWDVWRTKT